MDKVVNDIALVDEVGEYGLEGVVEGLAVIGLEDGLDDFEDAVAHFLLTHQVALQDLNADVDVFLEEFSVDLLTLPKSHEIHLQTLIQQHYTLLLALQHCSRRLHSLISYLPLTLLFVDGFGNYVSLRLFLALERRS